MKKTSKPTIWYIDYFMNVLGNMKGCYVTDAGYENLMDELRQMRKEVEDEK